MSIKKRNKLIGFALVSLLSIGLFSGCTSNSQTNEEKQDSKTITVIGSTSVTPVAQELAKAFEAKNENIRIDVQGVGSTAGVKAVYEGIGQIGMASRNLKSGEKEWNLNETIIAYDGIAVIAHPSNEVSNLKKDQINKIFKGEITNWKELGGVDKEIILISREAGSGTRGAFEELNGLLKKNENGKKISVVKEDALIAEGNGAVKANVASKENSIGYISLSYLDDSVKGLKVDEITASSENIMNGSYKISRPFLMLTNGEVSDDTKAYLEFILSKEGQEIVKKKLIPVN
ncbi:MAG: phosphate ABC transporter substrate-binding protein [Peptostreptococcaceae bacterium]|jgi:phosphate transport system substrate-binding protein|nr:phosphate ABC transporter substrate-binding protein [Peptostreptococcaceae bacterium]